MELALPGKTRRDKRSSERSGESVVEFEGNSEKLAAIHRISKDPRNRRNYLSVSEEVASFEYLLVCSLSPSFSLASLGIGKKSRADFSLGSFQKRNNDLGMAGRAARLT